MLRFRDGDSQHERIIEKTEPRDPIGNEIEWVNELDDGGDDDDEIGGWDLPIIAARISADQTQHRLEIPPSLLERFFRQ